MDKKLILNRKRKINWIETNTYRFNSTWFWHHIDPILCNNFSCRSKSTEKPILAVTDPPCECPGDDFYNAPCQHQSIHPKSTCSEELVLIVWPKILSKPQNTLHTNIHRKAIRYMKRFKVFRCRCCRCCRHCHHCCCHCRHRRWRRAVYW